MISTKLRMVALTGKDIIGLAQTGSGKTGAFAIPILQDLLQRPQPLFAVILSPTRFACASDHDPHIRNADSLLLLCRELAIQISEQFEALGSVIRARSVVIVGGIDIMEQSIALAKKVRITPPLPSPHD